MHLPPMHREAAAVGKLLASTVAKEGILQMIALHWFHSLAIQSLIEQICEVVHSVS